MDKTLGNERDPLQNGQECDYGPYYRRSSSLPSLNVIPSSTLTSILVKKVRVTNDKKKFVDKSKDYENYFNATVLEKVNAERRSHKVTNICNGCIDGFWAANFFSSNGAGCIYHGIAEAASHPDNPGKANTIFPSHYVIGWLADDSLVTFPPLFVMLGCSVANFPYPRLDTFLGMGDIFLLELALIVKTLVITEM
ncbi:hypothetical protein Cgig2_022191 [Carnegiea gigantea]|uniref:Uncharacterized protein n=1 Tax=Carnegiea gigantea TaxID=171969 RepID=A0A9Q1GTY6_9CARY|nr:hypothetical protein Cgig2_022191 [Carnegiea gigantea]